MFDIEPRILGNITGQQCGNTFYNRVTAEFVVENISPNMWKRLQFIDKVTGKHKHSRKCGQ